MRPWLCALAVLTAAIPAFPQGEIRERSKREWKTLKTKNFEIHYCDDDILERVREVGEWAEKAYKDVGGRLDTKLTRTAPIFVYRSLNDFQQTTVFPGGIPEGVLGVAELFQDRIVVPCVGSDKLMQRLIEHEFTHQLMFQAYFKWKIPSYLFLKDPLLPDWFVEGLAEWGAEDIDTTDLMLLRDSVLDDRMRHLFNLHGFGHLNPHEVREAYITGHYALQHLEEKYGDGSVKKVFHAWAGFPWPASRKLAPVTKKSYRAFDTEFRTALRKRFIEEAAGKTEPGKYATPLTENDSYYRRWNYSPRVSPDGRRIAYLSDRSKIDSVHVMNIDGSGKKSTLLLTVNNTIEFVDDSWSGVSWSPDSERIAFVGEWRQRKHIYVTDPGGLGVDQLGFEFEEMASPAWSPDGATIAFSGLASGRTDIWLGNIATGEVRRLTKDAWHDDHPCWSPDGRSIVYASERNGQTDLYVVDVETGEGAPLAETNANEATPAFSPDGKYLAYAGDDGGIWNVWIKELDGGKVWKVTDVIGGAMSPSWGPDNTLVFTSYRHGEFHIWKMTLTVAEGQWTAVPVTPPRDWYKDLQVKAVEDYTVAPLRDRWHLDYLMPLGLLNLASASTLTGKHQVYAGAALVGTEDGVRVDASLTYLNQQTPLDLFVGFFNIYQAFEERDIDREEHQYGGIVGTIVPLDPYRRLTLAYTLYENRIDFYDDDGLHNTDPTNGAMIAAITHDNVTGRGINPSGGFHLTGGVEWFRDFWGSDEVRTNYFWTYRQYIEFWEDVVLVLGSDGRLSHGPQSDAGDASSVVRGYRFGRHWGRNVAGAFAEVRFPIWRDINWSFPGQLFLIKDVRGYVFGDVGFASDQKASVVLRHSGQRDWRHSVGGGVRVDFWILEKAPLPIALEVAQPTDSHQRIRFSFAIGFSF